MEKRIVLAALLSFFILYYWSLLTHKQVDASYHIDNKEVTDTLKESKIPAQPSESLPKTEIIKALENSKIKAEFSNIGGALKRITIKEYGVVLPVENLFNLSLSSNYQFKLDKLDDSQIVYSYSDDRLDVQETFTILPDDYLIKANIKIKHKESSILDNKSINFLTVNMSNLYKAYVKKEALLRIVDNSNDLYFNLISSGYLSNDGLILNKFISLRNLDDFELSTQFIDKKFEIFNFISKEYENSRIGGEHDIDKNLFEYVIFAGDQPFRKNNAFKFTDKDKKSKNEKVNWYGFRDRYYCAIVKPEFPVQGFHINPVNLLNKNEQDDAKKVYLDLNMGADISDEQIKIGESMEFSSTIYAGPENLYILKKYQLGFEKIKMFYRFGLFDAISHIIYSMLHFVYRLIPNWGVCIILISSFIYLSLSPLTLKGMSSMKKMQEIQPKIASLREKHKNNPQKLNKELMEIYKTHKINPLSGCLPLLLQMPVFIGLYQVFWRDVSFKDSGFLWIKDLSQPDKLITFPVTVPIVGQYFNVLPILMVIIMFFQQKMTSKNMVLTDPQQIAQQKMMGVMLPVMLGFIFYNFASGLNLYFTVLYALQTFIQWKMSKQNKTIDG